MTTVQFASLLAVPLAGLALGVGMLWLTGKTDRFDVPRDKRGR
ncbi:hypothetical protein [Methylobacterium sp. E-066]|nr:hypothetical protein [Methylobacterium sp. E-066]